MTPDEPEGDVLGVVRRGFEAFNRADVNAVLTLADPEVEVYMPPPMVNSGMFLALHLYPSHEQALEVAQQRERTTG